MWRQDKSIKPYQLSISIACWKSPKALSHAQCHSCFKEAGSEAQGKDCWHQWEKGRASEQGDAWWSFEDHVGKCLKLARNTLQSHSHDFFGSSRWKLHPWRMHMPWDGILSWWSGASTSNTNRVVPMSCWENLVSSSCHHNEHSRTIRTTSKQPQVFLQR